MFPWLVLQATGAAAASTPPSTLDQLVVAIVAAIFGGALAMGGTYVINLVGRNWTHQDRQLDRTHEHADRDNDRLWGASTRELDQVWEALREIQKTQIDIQKGLLRVELRIEAVEGYVETQKTGLRLRGRAEAAS
jgi:sugar phosphate isomerase/epimerase